MARRLPQRQAALAGVALLAAASSLAVTGGGTHEESTPLPVSEGSYTALAGPTGAAAIGTKTSCGIVVKASTQGITNPVLPCGVQLYVGFRGRKALATVIGRGPVASGRQFGLTNALAGKLGLEGVQRIRWSYAGAG